MYTIDWRDLTQLGLCEHNLALLLLLGAARCDTAKVWYAPLALAAERIRCQQRAAPTAASRRYCGRVLRADARLACLGAAQHTSSDSAPAESSDRSSGLCSLALGVRSLDDGDVGAEDEFMSDRSSCNGQKEEQEEEDGGWRKRAPSSYSGDRGSHDGAAGFDLERQMTMEDVEDTVTEPVQGFGVELPASSPPKRQPGFPLHMSAHACAANTFCLR